MAFRLDKAIVRGEISNAQRGRVTGRIWLLGRKEPLELELNGNCLRDLAGCTLRFRNPSPSREQLTDLLQTRQTGTVGDMTASRKSKVPTVPEEELMHLLQAKQPIPCVLANTLYLEWFSEANGRVVIESGDCQLDISDFAWRMTGAEELVQTRQSQENFFRFLDHLTGVEEDEEGDFLEDEEAEVESDDELDSALTDLQELGLIELEERPLDEFEWERELRDADRRAEAYQEAFDRYRDHPDRERLIAEAMGWDADDAEDVEDEWEDVTNAFIDGLGTGEAAMHQAQESAAQDREDAMFADDGEDAEEAHHPLSKRAMRFALRLQEDAEGRGLLGCDKGSKDSPLLSVIVSIIALGGKLAAALDGTVMGYDPEPGFIIAMLKRAQIPLNEALHSLGSIDMKSLSKDTQMWLATARSELFDLRKDILDVMKELRQQ
ncbi:MAG: hypothetical protein KA004_11720 [Verrucomicrobiales bacterium]|nr:hypothetical protein [Verrucomicrobiales bacterium]